MSQLGDPTDFDYEAINYMFRRGPPRSFLDRFSPPANTRWICDGCKKEALQSDTRFRCLSCDDFDFCQSCHETAFETHPPHEFAVTDGSMTAREMDKYLLPYPDADSSSRAAPDETKQPTLYPYRPLDTSQHEIRLLALLPGAAEDEIACRMAHAPLFAKLSYEALSYTWGDQTAPVLIRIDGVSLAVGQSLAGALRALRQTDATRYLWVDAVCINQRDDVEKSREVQRMRHVYVQATGVVIWLGEASQDDAFSSDDAMALANNQTLGTFICGTDTHWAALDRLVRRPWWSRVWCLQEAAAAARPPLVLCGRQTASWIGLHDACRKLPDYWKRTRTTAGEEYALASADLTFQRHSSIRNQYINGEHFRLLYLLYMTLAWEATDPRDKVFAVVGLCRSEDRDALPPDYSLNVREVYLRTARHLMTTSLNLLSLNTGSPRLYPSAGAGCQRLPSWVPDWSLGASRPPPLWREGCYAASNVAPHTRYWPALMPGDDPDVVRLVGSLIGRVQHVGDVIVADATSWAAPAWTGFYETIRSVETFFRQCVTADGPDIDLDRLLYRTRFDWIWRTLIADREYPQLSWSWPASADFAAAYHYHRERAWGRDTGSTEENTYHRRAYPVLAKHTLNERRVFLTRDGLFGVCAKNVEPGDVVVILAGGDMPYILRPTPAASEPDKEAYLFVSDAFAYGAMDGQVFRLHPNTEFPIA
ncbi:heterokaryon incompatibility protein [Grosmannia clavigera kw1407]|uniref:Heterokaryon incompatibility protein n=1 Tax=Grosmannia clavigera (strain kw1407 / UAMH 11150) TaxID=655863 RepID=F0XU83_GROCL|nr:heterokaryon incompatibility protein [Grosmannia clavigera kw1407]EFW98735.1 heterokaryon incompatibility protein [Grosmannia clavigera kw1407]